MALPIDEAREIRVNICQLCKITPITLRRWMYIALDEEKDIPAKKLDIIAKVLGRTSDDLKNYSVTINLPNHEQPTDNKLCA
jgi:hypothetical protein